MFPDVDSRDLHAVVVLADELNVTRASQILRISQPALSKQINELEEHHQLHLFEREKGRIVRITDTGKVFVKEARAALFRTERAIHLAHAAHQGVEHVLLVGHSHYADRAWISALLAIRLPPYPTSKAALGSDAVKRTELDQSIKIGCHCRVHFSSFEGVNRFSRDGSFSET